MPDVEQYQSALTGPQMDQALLDMANHTSERFAKGTAEGVPASPGTVGYEDNSKYYKDLAANQAQAATSSASQAVNYATAAQTSAGAAAASAATANSEAYRATVQADRAEDAAERAEAIVGGQFVSYGGPQGLDDTEKAQARENIGAEISEEKSATPGAIVTFNDGAAAPLEELEVELAIDQDLNGYTHPWPAGGGKNLYNIANQTSNVNNTFLVINVAANTTYTFSVDVTQNALYAQYDNGGTWTSFATAYTKTFLTFNSGEYTNIRLMTYNTSGPPSKFQLELGTAATEWAPYANVCPITPHTAANITVNSNLYTVQLGGSYYAGELDVKTRRLTVTHGVLIFDGTQSGWNAYNYNTGFQRNIPGMRQGDFQPGRANWLKTATSSTEAHAIRFGAGNNRIYCLQVQDLASTVEDWNAYLAANPLEVVYPLATPLVIQLDPATIYTEEGSNTVQADTGDILALSYRTKGSVQVEDFAGLLEETTAGAGTSNRNLLDNSSFLINQRGVSGTLSNGYGLDRWIAFASGGSVSYDATAKTVTLTATSNVAYLQQKAEDDLRAALDGKTVTFSVLTTDGIVYKNTFTYDASAHDSGPYFPDNAKLRFWYGGDFALCLRVEAPYAITIKRIKLELGDKSTIANDVPDIAEELAACQRYGTGYENTLTGGISLASSISSTDSSADIMLTLPATLRATPTITVTGAMTLFNPAGYYFAVSSVTVAGIMNNRLLMRCNASGLTQGTVYRLVLNAGAKIYISSDL